MSWNRLERYGWNRFTDTADGPMGQEVPSVIQIDVKSEQKADPAIEAGYLALEKFYKSQK